MTNILYPADYAFGTKEEDKIVPLLKEFFKRDIKRSEDKFAKHDFYDEEYTYELKSRTNKHDKYPTTMITQDKIVRQNNKKLILLFNFTNGLYYIEYDEEKFKSYESKSFSRAKVNWNEKPHLFISIEDLKPLQLSQ
jgi:hypothetical protein